MARRWRRFLKRFKSQTNWKQKVFEFRAHFGDPIADIEDILVFPMKVIAAPFTLAFNIAVSASRGYGIPEFISNLSYASVFTIAALGTYDIAIDVGKKLICQRDCRTCSGWQALRCTKCRGSGKVHYQVKNYTLRSGEKPTAESVASAIVENRAELVHLPSTIDLNTPLPCKDCPTCDGTGVMSCYECKGKLQVKIAADNITEPPWKAYEILKKMDYPYEHIVYSMKDLKIAAFWLITLPQLVGGFEYDDEIKQKIWWQYKESTRYDQLRDEVAKRKPGWEHLQEAMISVDPARARDDPIIVKNVPYYRATKALEAEVMKLDPPPRPENWGELDLPLNASHWSEEDLKNPNKLYEMTVLLNAQREYADKILDSQWETKWRQAKLDHILMEKVWPHIKNADSTVISDPIIIPPPPPPAAPKEEKRRRWLFFW